ncbi:hypothetical protein INR49_028341 [Caranx melampygus]|nr:hypothetical protein INR49_028341 [Caranx melampygus]
MPIVKTASPNCAILCKMVYVSNVRSWTAGPSRHGDCHCWSISSGEQWSLSGCCKSEPLNHFRTLIYPDLTKDETVVHHASLMAEVLQSPWWQKAYGSKPQHRAECSTNGRRRMRKVNAYTFCVGLGSAYPFADVSTEAPLHWLPLL